MPGEQSSTPSITIILENNFVLLGPKNFKLPGPDSRFPPLTINTSGHTNHMGFYMPPFLQAGAPVQNAFANNSTSPSSQDPNSILLEQQLELVLKTVQKKLQSGTFSPRDRELLNALVPTETPTPVTSGARLSSVRTSTYESLYSW